MAWVSHTLAFAILPDQADVGADLRTLLDGPKRAMDQFVYAPSRNGCVLWCFLKSHLALLRFAAESGRCVVYGEMNQ